LNKNFDKFQLVIDAVTDAVINAVTDAV